MPGRSPEQCQVREIAREQSRELFVARTGLAPEHLAPTAAGLQEEFSASALCAEYFGPRLNGSSRELTQAVLADMPVPLTWVQGDLEALGAASSAATCGAHLWAICGADVHPLVLDGVTLGSVIDGPHATECLLGGIHPTDVSAPRDRQARETFERMERALAEVAMDFSHVARTWFFLDEILAWYGDFNHVRTSFFTERGVFDGIVPASTGIGGGNPHGAALVAGAYAVKPKAAEVKVEAVPSPLQCPALQYGSSFSRAVEITMPDIRRVLVSGTASIAPGGETEFLGDVAGQTARTCEVVAAILRSRGMDWADVTRATAYVRSLDDAAVFDEYCAAHDLPPLPTVTAHNVICRDDLLFELEVDAAQAR